MSYTFPTVYSVACHTDNVGPGTTFVAIKGVCQDGVAYIPKALAQGATTIVVHNDAVLSEELYNLIQSHDAVLTRVPNTRQALALLSAQAYGNPAEQLRLIGVTGTKGKTTSVFLLEHVLRTAGYKTALLSSAHNSIVGNSVPTHLTTQHPDYLHVFFNECVQQGVEWVVMEVAAQAFSLHRVDGLLFDAILFTNFDQTHAEFYATVDDYFAAKCRIFTQRKVTAPVVINADNHWCLQAIEQQTLVATYSLVKQDVTFPVKVVENTGHSVTFDALVSHAKVRFSCPSLIGLFSVYNLAGVACLALQLGIDVSSIVQAFASFGIVPGRLERYQLANGATCIIDYAHNTLSFESILSTLRPLTNSLIVVFGCGGDRDRTMRPRMGAVAVQYADTVIVTTDNPRSEDVVTICADIVSGIGEENKHKLKIIVDRKEAIEYAYSIASDDTFIAILGKGRDEYQLIGTQKTFFSDIQTVKGLC